MNKSHAGAIKLQSFILQASYKIRPVILLAKVRLVGQS